RYGCPILRGPLLPACVVPCLVWMLEVRSFGSRRRAFSGPLPLSLGIESSRTLLRSSPRPCKVVRGFWSRRRHPYARIYLASAQTGARAWTVASTGRLDRPFSILNHVRRRLPPRAVVRSCALFPR